MKSYMELIILIVNIVKYIVISYGILGFTISKSKKKYIIIPVYIISVILIFNIQQYVLLLDMFLQFITICLLYDTSIKNALKGFFIEYIFLSFIDLIVWLAVVGLTPLGGDIINNVQIISAVADIAGVIPWLILIMFFRKVKKAINARLISLKIREMIFIVIGMGSLAITVSCIQGIFIGEMTAKIQRAAMIVSIITSVFVIAIFGLFVYILDSKEKLQKINILNEECIKYQKEYYEGIIKFDEEMRAFRHDVNKHYSVIYELINREEYIEVKKYIDTLTQIKDFGYIYKTGNLIADYIINRKIAEINETKDVHIEVVGRFPESIKIENADLCIIIENALDNAKEALQKYSGSKALEIIIKNYKQSLYLTFINSSEKIDVANLVTSKIDKLNHGYGLKNIEKVVEKYGGIVFKEYNLEKFYLEIEI